MLLFIKVGIVITLVMVAGLVAGLVFVRRARVTNAAPKDPSQTPARPAPVLLNAGWSVTALLELEWFRFEQLVAAYEGELGHVVLLNALGSRHGFFAAVSDRKDEPARRLLHGRGADDGKVDAPLVQELHQAMIAENVDHGSFYTTTDFTAAARDFAAGKKIDLVKGREFLLRISRLSSEAQARLFDLALSPQYRIPTCPVCGEKMILREPAKRPKFWACLNTRDCTRTLELKRR